MQKKLAFFLATFVLSFCLVSTQVSAQYTNAIGVHVGSPAGVTYKHFMSDRTALEAIAGAYFGVNGGASLTLLVEQHAELFMPNLNLVYGLGGHVGVASSSLMLGADGIVGFEYTFDAPINFMFNVKPTIGLQDRRFLFTMGGGLALRYILN